MGLEWPSVGVSQRPLVSSPVCLLSSPSTSGQAPLVMDTQKPESRRLTLDVQRVIRPSITLQALLGGIIYLI